MKSKLNVLKFVDLLMGVSFWTMALYMAINARPIRFSIIIFIILYLLIGMVFIFKRKPSSRI